MEDAIARDGALARCNQDRSAAEKDIECANARRAAEAVAVAAERARREELERRSERALIALRDRQALEQQAAERAAAEARAAADAAYDAQWVDESSAGESNEVPPAPEGIVAFDVYADGRGRLPVLHELEASLAPPPSDFTIARPEVSFDQPAIPRPFRTAETVAASP